MERVGYPFTAGGMERVGYPFIAGGMERATEKSHTQEDCFDPWIFSTSSEHSNHSAIVPLYISVYVCAYSTSYINAATP